MAATNRRVLMVALDGLEVSILQRAMASGRLPNLAAFAEGALRAEVASDGERLEGSVWPTFTSGTGPGTHASYWYMQWLAEESNFVRADHPAFRYSPWWEAALEADRRVVVFDLAYVPTVRRPNMRSYIGWGTQDELIPRTYPKSFGRQIRAKYGRSKVEMDTLLVDSPDKRLRLARKLRSGTRQRSAMLLDLVAAQDWDLMVFSFGEFHAGGHYLAIPEQLSPKVTSEGAFVSTIKPLDDLWPAIVAAAGDDCDIVLFSVHGMRPRVNYTEALGKIIDVMEGKEAPPPPGPDSLRRVRDLIPQGLAQMLWLRLPPAFRAKRMAGMMHGFHGTAGARAFSLPNDSSAALRVNMAGRELHGLTPAADAGPLINAIWAEASRYVANGGGPAFVDMFRTSEVFPGPRQHRLPDAILMTPFDLIQTSSITRDDGFVIDLAKPVVRNGAHTGRGFCFYRPAGGATLVEPTFDNLDFAPTILERLGVTPPGHLEGKPFLR